MVRPHKDIAVFSVKVIRSSLQTSTEFLKIKIYKSV